jgi:hypothetical protein
MKCARPGCTHELTSIQIERKNRYCCRKCVALNRQTDRIERAKVLGIHVSTHRRADRAKRLVKIGDTERIYSSRRCANCAQARNIERSNRLCTVCLAAGYRWCGYHRHVVTTEGYNNRRRMCRPCRQEYDNARGRRLRGGPPDGYISLKVAAKRIGYGPWAVQSAIQRGWMAGYVWRRGPRCNWYIEDRASYPTWGE